VTRIVLEHIQLESRSGERRLDLSEDIITILPGERVALLGPSGSGKTSLLRVIAGLEKPTAGTVTYDSTPLERIPNKERGIGMVFQENALFPHVESRESVGFFLKLRKREHEVPDRVREIASITGFEIDTLMGKIPRELSGGEAQRVSIARALTRDLSVLLLDEPFAHLDVQARMTARTELARLLNRYKVTTVLATHDQHEAEALSKRVLLMREGRIVQAGAFRDLMRTPRNLFVARFTGDMPLNELEGFARDGEWRGRNFGPYPIRQDLPKDARVLLAVRPIDMTLDAEGVEGRVTQVTPFFERRQQVCHVEAGPDTWTILMSTERQVTPGDRLHCGIRQEAIMYFDPDTGRRIG
jgi:multiple sugar transport system ATP-binding protein